MSTSHHVIILFTIFATVVQGQHPSFHCETLNKRDIAKGTPIECNANGIHGYEEFLNITSKFEKIYELKVNLNIFDSFIVEFPESFIGNFKKLQMFYGEDVGLKQIAKNVFNKSVYMKTILLSRNKLTTLVNGSFEGINAETIFLARNRIENIELDAFKDSKIDFLNLRGNRLKSITFLNSMFRFKSVQFADNYIEDFSINTVKRENYDQHMPNINLQYNKFKTFNCSSNIQIETIELQKNEELLKVDTINCQIYVLYLTEVIVEDNPLLEVFTSNDTEVIYQTW